MRKLLIVLTASLALAANVFGESPLKDGMLIEPGSMNVTVGFDFGLGVNAGYEYALGSFDIDTLRFTYGAKAIGGLYFGGGVGLGMGAVGTLHFAWGCLDLPPELSWVKNIDSFIGVGVGYADGLGIVSHGGSSYFFKENMAVTVAGGLGGSYLGVLLKL
jgi:hypothetical protein